MIESDDFVSGFNCIGVTMCPVKCNSGASSITVWLGCCS